MQSMDDVLGYDGATVVVTGAASGMGAAAAQILVDLGAEVTAIDIKPTDVPVAHFLEVDLRDRGAIEDAAAAIGGAVDGLFSCAGLPGPPFSELDTMRVNFVGARHLAEQLVPKMHAGSSISAISSSAAVGWWDQMETIGPLLATSPRCSYVAGEVFAVDGGFQGARYTGRHQAGWADLIDRE
jgi:NAD(P)-dependent dehydrogenase (short-subunit alcohol dehydrogenase family)